MEFREFEITFFTKKSWGISIKIPAPSPVFPSALTAPRVPTLQECPMPCE